MKRIFNKIILDALKNQCSDIHIDIDEECVIKIRKKGVIYSYDYLEYETGRKLINYIYYKANLDILNVSALATGKIHFNNNENDISLRVSTLPSIDQSSIVIRILNNHDEIDINKLSIIDAQCNIIKSIAKLKNGLVILTGKTGSGKTTTLYALLEYINTVNSKKIITLEDPIERKINNTLQVNVNQDIISFFDVLKQVLRHDPDIIVIGEIRDYNDLKLAIQAALSGHLVITTMHAISALFAINRIQELDIYKNDLIATIKLISYQEIIYTEDNTSSIYEFISNKEVCEYLEHNKLEYKNVSYYKSIIKKRYTIYEG